MKYWEVIVNKIIKAGFSVGLVLSARRLYGRAVWTVDAHGDGMVRADEMVTAFVELKLAFRACGDSA